MSGIFLIVVNDFKTLKQIRILVYKFLINIPFNINHEFREILDASRKKRIAGGSGTTVADINKLLKQFEQMKKMMKMLGNGNFPMMGGGKMPGMKFPF